MESNKKNIADLYSVMMETISKLQTGQMEVSVAKAINESAQVLINVAKVECEYIKLLTPELRESTFLKDKDIKIKQDLNAIRDSTRRDYMSSGKTEDQKK